MRLVRLFPELFSIDDFIVKDIPTYHPDSRSYSLFWEEQEKYCVEGKWGKDGDKWRYCPGFLYYYVNFTVIEDEDLKSKSANLFKPILRDLEWYVSYGWLTCRGFSGFVDDEEFTCNRIVDKIERKIELTPEEKVLLGSMEYLKDSNGNYKKYIEAREYLYNKCDSPKGLPIYDNAAKNLFWLGSRGLGKSFYEANAIIGHEFNFYGKKYYKDYIADKVRGPEIVVGAASAPKSKDLLNKFEITQEYHKVNNGSFGSGEDLIPGFFYRNTEGTLQPNNKGSYKHLYEVKEGGVKRKKGTGSTIHHLTYTIENPQAAVGTRPTVMVIDEVGLLENLIDVHTSNEYCQKRKTKFGSSIYTGTGGNIDKIVECKIVFEHPSEYNFLEYKDLWEDRQDSIGMFIPAYYGSSIFIDDKGNTDIEAAYAQELHIRQEKENAKNSFALDSHRMGKPLVPSEMFLSKSSFTFPVVELRERELELDLKKVWEKNVSIGDLEWSDKDKKSVRWREDISKNKYSKAINTLNIDSFKGDLTGKICIYEHPMDDIPRATHMKSLYKVVYDPIKDDNGGTSLASVLVHKGYTDNYNEGLQNTIVAEWIGRYDQINDNHLMAIKLAMYYQSKILFENNLPNFITFCRMEGYYHILQRTPWDAIKDAIKEPGRKQEVGVTQSGPLKINCEQLIRQSLLEPFLKLEDKTLCNVYNIYSLRMIRELSAYNREGNFDHVSSYMILMLWLSQEKKKVYTYDDITEEDREINQLKEHFNNMIKTENYEQHVWYRY